MNDQAAMTDEQRAAAILATQRLNLLTRAKNGERLRPDEWDELRRIANDKSGAPSWPDRATCAAELGLTGHQLAGLARRGMPADKAGRIDQVPVLLWLWQNRAELVALANDDDPEEDDRREKRREEIEALRLKNETRSKAHLEAAQRFVAEKFRAIEAALTRDLAGQADNLWRLAQGERAATVPKLVATLRQIVADTVTQAVDSCSPVQ